MASQHIKTLLDNPSAITFHPAIEDDIYNTNQFLHNNSLASLPEEYCNFLKITDGLSYNNIEFFGCSEHKRAEKNYTFPSLIDINIPYIPFKFFNRKVVIGQLSENIITYDQENTTYTIADRINLSTRIEVDNLKNLFQILLDIRGIE